MHFSPVNLTNHKKLSINTIDFFSKVCYTEIKLENKINILTNKTKTKTNQKQKGNNMAETLKLPNQVINSRWDDDVDVDYAIYGGSKTGEREYISPSEVSKESIDKIKQFQQYSIRSLRKYRKEQKLAA